MMRRGIPQYFLYGEASQDVDGRFLHIESVAERSRLHDWTIRPHAHRDLHHLLLIARGAGSFQFEGGAQLFTTPALVIVPLACVHGFEFKPGTDGWIVTASGALLHRMGRDHPELVPVIERAGAMQLPAGAAADLHVLFEALAGEFRGNSPGRRTAAESLLAQILVRALRRSFELEPAVLAQRGPDTRLVERYRGLIEQRYRQPLGIADYAARLCVSQERLRLACVRAAGSTPLALLNARRLLEAKRRLLYTNMNIAMIAERCGFEDPAYFSRFFARSTGRSPRAYRRRPDGDTAAD